MPVVERGVDLQQQPQAQFSARGAAPSITSGGVLMMARISVTPRRWAISRSRSTDSTCSCTVSQRSGNFLVSMNRSLATGVVPYLSIQPCHCR